MLYMVAQIHVQHYFANLGDSVSIHSAHNPMARQRFNVRDDDEIITFHYTFEEAQEVALKRITWKQKRMAQAIAGEKK